MPIDPTGTSPTPPAAQDSPSKVSMKCRRPGCDSITAEEIKVSGNSTESGRHMYRCLTCKLTWAISLGGSFNF